MEQKKTLWIIAAVGLFLAVIIGTACIIYTPATQTTPTITSISPFERTTKDASTGWTNPVDSGNYVAYVEDPVPAPAQTQSASVSDLVVLSDNTTVYTTPQYQNEGTTIDLNVLKNELAAELKPETKTQNQNINITVNVSDSTSANASAKVTEKQSERRPEPSKASEIKAPAPVQKEVKEAPKPAVQSPAPAVASVKVEKKTQVAAKTPAAPVKTETKKAPEPKKVTQYWVQVGAYSNKKTAEVARAALDENKIPSDIFTFKDAKENLFFRVRVGPYTTKSEAEYWRTRIIKIDDFAKAESYVVSTQN